ncbi:Septum-promoting GTP-binding protein 1 [Linum perenne]
MGRSKSNVSRKIHRRLSILRRCILRVWQHIMMCSIGKPIKYRMLSLPSIPKHPPSGIVIPHPPPPSAAATTKTTAAFQNYNGVGGGGLNRVDSDLVALKISLLGDPHIGKTSFLAKYVGGGEETDVGLNGEEGLNWMDKVLEVGGARISYSLWEVDGGEQSKEQIPVACKDSVAILIMFDLTSRVTLNGVMKWYQEARKWNQTAIPILIGTKFDDFIQLPIDLQWTIASQIGLSLRIEFDGGQARAYAKALNATLFFSSATYNINVNKIFKFVTAKLFDLPWTVERNLTIGEPIIDF